MNIFHPGGWELTKQAAELCGFKTGDRILDIGCGEGVTMSRLRDELGIKPIGCDRDENILKRAKERDPSLKLRTTDGVMLDFPSKYFDGAILECSFSLMTRHDELLHELWCILKDGGSFAISDLYIINPDMDRAGEVYYEARRKLNTPKAEGKRNEDEEFPSPYLLDERKVAACQ
jgi:ubiquinone/menaquinone biosynthesis C-methylase UbiE